MARSIGAVAEEASGVVVVLMNPMVDDLRDSLNTSFLL